MCCMAKHVYLPYKYVQLTCMGSGRVGEHVGGELGVGWM